MILKIQRPLFTTEAVAPALIYNRDKSVIFTIDWSVVSFMFRKGELKIYIRGTARENEPLRVYKILNPKLRKCQF